MVREMSVPSRLDTGSLYNLARRIALFLIMYRVSFNQLFARAQSRPPIVVDRRRIHETNIGDSLRQRGCNLSLHNYSPQLSAGRRGFCRLEFDKQINNTLNWDVRHEKPIKLYCPNVDDGCLLEALGILFPYRIEPKNPRCEVMLKSITDASYIKAYWSLICRKMRKKVLFTSGS